MITNASLELILDKYASFVIYHVLTKGSQILVNEISHILISTINFPYLAKRKYSSSILEKVSTIKYKFKCLDKTIQPLFMMTINLICSDNSIIKDLLLDQYGIFIIHKLIEKTNGQIQMSFLTIIAQNIKYISLTNYNQKIINVLYTKYPLIRQIELYHESKNAYSNKIYNMNMYPNRSNIQGQSYMTSSYPYNSFNASQIFDNLSHFEEKNPKTKKK